MQREQTEIYCAECGTWLVVNDHGGTATCECGSEFTVTTTPVAEKSSPDRTPSPRGYEVRRSGPGTPEPTR